MANSTNNLNLAPTRNKVAYLAWYGLSAAGIAWALDLEMTDIAPVCRSLGMRTRTRPCKAHGMRRASVVRYLLDIGVPPTHIHALTGYSMAYVRRCAAAVTAPYRYVR